MLGVTTVTYIATDAAGNPSEPCSFTVTIVDLNPPKFTLECPLTDINANADPGVCEAALTIPVPEVTDPCNEPITLVNDYNNTGNASDSYPVGVTVITWTATDASGNPATCEQTVTVTDTQAPTITCQGDVEDQITNGGCDFVSDLVTEPVITDNCPDPELTYVLTFEDGTTLNGTGSAHLYAFPVGKTEIHYTVTDGAGLTDECTYTVWMKSPLGSQFDVDCDPAVDVNVFTDANKCDAYVTPTPPLIVNPCNEVYSITNDYTNTSDATGTYPIGTTTVTWTIIDASLNEYTCTQDVTVTDNQAPTITCQGDVEDQITNGGCDFVSDLVTEPVITDNCPDPELTYVLTFEDGTTLNGTGSAHLYAFPVGKTEIHYTVTDGAGLTDECTYTVWMKNPLGSQFDVDCDPAVDVNVFTDANKCDAYVTPTPPLIVNPCNEVYSITNDYTNTQTLQVLILLEQQRLHGLLLMHLVMNYMYTRCYCY